MKPQIQKEHITPLFESKYIKVFDLEYEKGKHYYDATRRPLDHLMAIKTDEEFQSALPDAVTCVVILQLPDEEAKLLLTREFRYPTGQFLLSPPAGLLDEEDKITEDLKEILRVKKLQNMYNASKDDEDTVEEY